MQCRIKNRTKVRCKADSAGADLSFGTQSSRRTRCGSAQSRHRKVADIRRFILVKLWACLEIFVGCLLSIAVVFWV